MSLFSCKRPDRFRALTWIFWVQAIFMLGMGLFCFFAGVEFWNGMVDAKGEERRELGRNLCLGSSVFFLFATTPLAAIAARVKPMMRCYCEGIECRVLGRTALSDIPLVPGIVLMLWALCSRQAFRRETFRIAWKDFGGATVTGIATMYRLNLQGRFLDETNGRVIDTMVYPQAAFTRHPQEIADALNSFAADPVGRGELVSWSDLRIT